MKIQKQLRVLGSYPTGFAATIADVNGGSPSLRALSLKTFQINVGKQCNQTCVHCHVDAGPTRTESMTRETAERCMEIVASLPEVETVDITGGAPEICPQFRYLVTESKRLGKHVIDRNNLTINEVKAFNYLYDFLTDHEVEIVASLPYFAASRTDQQRGDGVFDASITALQKFNAKGYGINPKLPLHLVYNPSGLFLSAPQTQLEREFKDQLDRRYGIVFNNLYCINNLPINRFLASLVRKEKFEEYMTLLVNAYNPGTLEGLMCRHQISVGWDGRIYDCDFNQMLDLTVEPVAHIDSWDYERFMKRAIRTANHCFGCTAGAGSSCGGELVTEKQTTSSER